MNSSKSHKKELAAQERDDLLNTLKTRFEKNKNRHPGIDWAAVQARLESHPDKLWSLHEMERTGGEPDVVGHDKKTGAFLFMIAPRKVPKAAEVFVTTAKPWTRGKSTSRGQTLWTWRLPWALNC